MDPDCCLGLPPKHQYPPFLEFLEEILESTFLGDSLVLLGDFNAHVGTTVRPEGCGREEWPH